MAYPTISITCYCTKCGKLLNSDGDDPQDIKVEPHNCVSNSTILTRLIQDASSEEVREYLEKHKLDMEIKGEI